MTTNNGKSGEDDPPPTLSLVHLTGREQSDREAGPTEGLDMAGRGTARRLVGWRLVAVLAVVLGLVAPLPRAVARPTPTGGITTAAVMPGSAAQGSAATAENFTVDVRAEGLLDNQDVKSILLSVPASGWAVVGPAPGTVGDQGWTVQAVSGTSVCWGGRSPLASESAVTVSAVAWTDSAVGTATWTVQAYGDSRCLREVRPALAAPVAEAYVAVAQVVLECAAQSSCSTEVVTDAGLRSSVTVTGTGAASDSSFVSAAMFEDLTGAFGTLTCPETPSYDPELGRTAQTVVSGAARSHVVSYTLAKSLVNLLPDNGAARMAVCLRSEIPFITSSGQPAQPVGLFRLPGSGAVVQMYDGFVPRCGQPAAAPCILDQFKRDGDMVWNIVLPPGDPYVH